MPIIKRNAFILSALLALIPCCQPVFAARVGPSWECIQDLKSELDSVPVLEDRLRSLLMADAGPGLAEKALSSIARAHARIKWPDRPAFWPFVKSLARGNDESAQDFHRIIRAAREARVFDTFEVYRATYGARVKANGTFTIKNPNFNIKTRYSRVRFAADLDLIYRGMATKVPHEIMQIRAIFADGSEKTMFEVEGTADEVLFNAKEAAEATLALYRARINEFSGLVRFDITHNHPGEPFFLILQTGESTVITLDLTPEDIAMAHQFQQWMGNFNVSVTALIGLQPGMITRSSFSPTGKFR